MAIALRPKHCMYGFLLAFAITGGIVSARGTASSTASSSEVSCSSCERRISVTGSATVPAAPDVATVAFAVVTQGDIAQRVREENETASAAALGAVRKLDIPDRNIRMYSLQLRPVREYDRERGEYIYLGYEAVREVRVRVENIDLIPELVANTVARGANRLDRVTYDLQDRTEATEQALREAVVQARRKAGAMAQALGAEVGDAVSIEERSFSFPRAAVRAEQFDAAASADPAAYAAGEIEVETQVHVVFELYGDDSR